MYAIIKKLFSFAQHFNKWTLFYYVYTVHYCTHLLLSWVHIADAHHCTPCHPYFTWLHFLSLSIAWSILFTRCATLEGKSLYCSCFTFLILSIVSLNTLHCSVNIWFGNWRQVTIFNPAWPGTNCIHANVYRLVSDNVFKGRLHIWPSLCHK